MKAEIEKSIKKALTKLYPSHKDVAFTVEYAPDNIDADFASNVAMVLAKKVGKKPMDLAEEIAAEIAAVAVAPGFVNISLDQKTLLNVLEEIVEQGDSYGESQKKSAESVLVEYFQPNIAKPLHVGHMRSAIIGDSIYRLKKLFHKKVESDTHMGDWGTQFGMLIARYKHLLDTESETAAKMLEDVGVAATEYAKYSYAAETQTEDEMREIAKQEFVKLEKGDEKNRKIWKQMVDTSMKEFLKINELLDISEFDHHWPESFYEDKMPAVVELLKEKGLLKESQGAQVVDLETYTLGTAIVIKSDGGTTYLLRDLATFLFRSEEQGFASQLYVVDVRQSHHFQQMFKILELLGKGIKSSVHLEFGFMKLPTGTLSTRKGNVVNLQEFVDEAEKRALEIINEKNPRLENKQTVSKQIALGAIKYADLKSNRKTDIVFDWDQALSFEGNTGPYLQYTHARLKSIIRKAEIQLKILGDIDISNHERTLLSRLLMFGDIINDSVETFAPHILAEYLFRLAGEANSFYSKVPVLQEEDKKKKEFRIALVLAVSQVLKNGLNLLGIEAPEEM